MNCCTSLVQRQLTSFGDSIDTTSVDTAAASLPWVVAGATAEIHMATPQLLLTCQRIVVRMALKRLTVRVRCVLLSCVSV